MDDIQDSARLKERKMRILRNLFLFAVLAAGSLTLYCYAYDDGDFQYWNSESLSVKLNNDWKAALSEEFRFGDDAGKFYYQHSDLGFIYSGMAKWIDIGLHYRHIFEKRSNDWKVENQPHLNLTLTWDAEEFKLSSLSYLSYRNREDAEDFWEYRNKFTLTPDWQFTRLKIQPYLADEIYINIDQGEFSRNRLFSGVKLALGKSIKAALFYLWQTTKGSDSWQDLNVLGTQISFSF